MHWPVPPYPPGFESPGIGFILLIGGIVFCLLGIVIYLTVKAALASPPPPANPAHRFQPDIGAETRSEDSQLP